MPLVNPRLRRETGTCPSGQQYYLCSKTGFIGCCSKDPCNDGCPDVSGSSASSDGGGVLTVTATSKVIVTNSRTLGASTTTTPITSRTSSATPSSSADESSTDAGAAVATASSRPISRASQTPDSASSSTAEAAGMQPSQSDGLPANSSSMAMVPRNSNARLIGGCVAGGVVLTLLALVIFFWLWRRKKHPEIFASPRSSSEDEKHAGSTAFAAGDVGGLRNSKHGGFLTARGMKRQSDPSSEKSPSLATTSTAAATPETPSFPKVSQEQHNPTIPHPQQAELPGSLVPANPVGIIAEAPDTPSTAHIAELGDSVGPLPLPGHHTQPPKKRFNPHRPHVTSWANYEQGVTGDGEISAVLAPRRDEPTETSGAGDKASKRMSNPQDPPSIRVISTGGH